MPLIATRTFAAGDGPVTEQLRIDDDGFYVVIKGATYRRIIRLDVEQVDAWMRAFGV